MAIDIVKNSNKVCKIYFIPPGFPSYWTSIESNRGVTGWNYDDFETIKNSQDNRNYEYEGVFISYFEICNEHVFIEHNEQLSKNEIDNISSIVV